MSKPRRRRTRREPAPVEIRFVTSDESLDVRNLARVFARVIWDAEGGGANPPAPRTLAGDRPAEGA